MTNGNQKTLNTQDVLSMKGAGYYSKRTAGAKDAIDSIQEILERSVLSLTQREILSFADFGAADGGTSQELWYNLIKLLRSRGDNRAIEIIYTDLASNDFSTLFNRKRFKRLRVYTHTANRMDRLVFCPFSSRYFGA